MIATGLLLAYLLVGGIVLGALLCKRLRARDGGDAVPWHLVLLLPTFWLPIAVGLGLYVALRIFIDAVVDR